MRDGPFAGDQWYGVVPSWATITAGTVFGCKKKLLHSLPFTLSKDFEALSSPELVKSGPASNFGESGGLQHNSTRQWKEYMMANHLLLHWPRIHS